MRCSYNQHDVEPEYRLYRHFMSFSSADLCLTVIATSRKTIRGSSEVRIIIYRRIVQDESGKLVMKSGRHAVNFVRVLNSITKCTHQIWCWELTKVLQGMLNSSLITSRWNIFSRTRRSFIKYSFPSATSHFLCYFPVWPLWHRPKWFFEICTHGFLPEENNFCTVIKRKLHFFSHRWNIFTNTLRWGEKHELLSDPIHFFVMFERAARLAVGVSLHEVEIACPEFLAMGRHEGTSGLSAGAFCDRLTVR